MNKSVTSSWHRTHRWSLCNRAEDCKLTKSALTANITGCVMTSTNVAGKKELLGYGFVIDFIKRHSFGVLFLKPAVFLIANTGRLPWLQKEAT